METFSALLAFVRGIHRSPVNSPHNGQWRGALMFFLSAPEQQLSKQWRHRWFETPLRSLWRHCNGPTFAGIADPQLISEIHNKLSPSLRMQLFLADSIWIKHWEFLRGASQCAGSFRGQFSYIGSCIFLWVYLYSDLCVIYFYHSIIHMLYFTAFYFHIALRFKHVFHVFT